MKLLVFNIDKNVRKVLDEEQIDLILMDRNLPGIEGSAFINEIKKQGFQILLFM